MERSICGSGVDPLLRLQHQEAGQSQLMTSRERSEGFSVGNKTKDRCGAIQNSYASALQFNIATSGGQQVNVTRFVHSRYFQTTTLEIFKTTSVSRTIIHCFNNTLSLQLHRRSSSRRFRESLSDSPVRRFISLSSWRLQFWFRLSYY